jgi:hypothetical protein
MSKQAKDVIAQVADGLGGADGLLRWVQEDPANAKVFWGGMYVKLLPLQLTGADGGAVAVDHSVKVKFV